LCVSFVCVWRPSLAGIACLLSVLAPVLAGPVAELMRALAIL